jgi:hypothetical protein
LDKREEDLHLVTMKKKRMTLKMMLPMVVKIHNQSRRGSLVKVKRRR